MNNPLRQIVDSFQHYQQLPAFCIDNTFYTYRDLAERIKGIQNQILEAGPVPNSNIGVMTFNDIETYASILAILFSGHAFVPINPEHPADRNEAILEQAEISIICSGGTIHQDFTKKYPV
ncbi:MAG: AMP-binding protein [Bacteroidetes bacterium]|nr:AMP-binding protein [Bacteroidota bacterium]